MTDFALVREYCHRDPLRMTLWVYHDHLTRVLPYMMKLRAGKVQRADVETLGAPLKAPRRKD